ncbi:MAG TPA: thioredoxin [Candidatus Pacearchaeota archaeon]|nr:thioredoxin [Candidatus Parcubacteria bacterium]HOC53436.1 thioredoxin [Candidatus Pacearchaeota archaeon]HQM24316.1 thioredoxin [Candidatus Pacearchaeota archaeon]
MEKTTDNNFEEIINGDKPVLIDFYTEWCPPCKMLSPIIEEIQKEFEGKIDVFKMDIDQNPISANKFQIDRIPTVVLFNKGEIKSSFIGFREKEDIKNWLNSNI